MSRVTKYARTHTFDFVSGAFFATGAALLPVAFTAPTPSGSVVFGFSAGMAVCAGVFVLVFDAERRRWNKIATRILDHCKALSADSIKLEQEVQRIYAAVRQAADRADRP